MIKNTYNSNAPQQNKDGIILIAIVKTIWDGRKKIIWGTLGGILLGLVIAFATPSKYTASTTLVPQISNKSSEMGGLSSLAAMAGFNIDMEQSSSVLSPYIYPQIIQSVPFVLELMNTPFTISDEEKPVTLFEYYNEIYRPGFFETIRKYTIGLPRLIIDALRREDENEALGLNPINAIPITITIEQDDVRKIIIKNVSLVTNDKDGYIVLTSVFHESLLSAQVTNKANELLQRYITNFKIEKARAQLEFIEGRYSEIKVEYEKAQEKLAVFRDRNKNVTSSLVKTQESLLENEFQLTFDVYSNLAQQLEEAKINVKEETPVFSIINPVMVPVKRTKPKRASILIIWTFLGGVVGIGWIFGMRFIKEIKLKWDEF